MDDDFIKSVEKANPGRKFAGWVPSSDNWFKSFSDNRVLPYNKNSIFYPRTTPINYTVNWDLDGGYWVSGQQLKSDYTYIESIKLPDYTKVKKKGGYYVTGWYVAGSSSAKAPGEWVSKLTTTEYGTVTIKAQWSPIEITADANGSTFIDPCSWDPISPNQCYKSKVETYDDFPIPSDDIYEGQGLAFNGTYKYNNTIIYPTDEAEFSKTIYVNWEKEGYYIRFHGNTTDGSGTINQSGLIQYDGYRYIYQDKISIYPDQDSSQGNSTSLYVYRQGYKFVGFSNEDGSTYYYKVSDNPSTLTISDLGKNNSQVEFYAQWTPINYTIEYNLNDQSTTGRSISPTPYSIPSQTVAYDTEFSLAGIGGASCLGYHFLGWGLTKTGDTVLSNYARHNLTDKDGDTVTLYAKWEPNSYTIKFNSSGRTLKSGSMPGDRNLTYEDTLLMPGIESLGLIFVGWKSPNRYFYYDNDNVFGSNNCSVKSIVQGVEEEKVITLYAQWEDTWANDENWGEDLMPPQSFGYYEISKPAHLGWIARQLQSGDTLAGVSFKQQGNIDLGDLPWLSEGLFEGEYNGNGYYILNIHTTDNINVLPSNFEGLFAQTSGAVLQNIHILSGNFVGESNVGSIVGYAEDTIIRNCVNHANVSGNAYVGGIAGMKGETDPDLSNSSMTVSGCVNYGQVISNDIYVGGLFGGTSDIIIEACYVRANVICKGKNLGSYAGGIVGLVLNDLTISSCAFVGYCTGNGFTGYSDGDYAYVTCCLVDSTNADNLLSEGAKNCVAYANGELQTDEPSEDDTNWTKINGKWIPSALVWIGN